jgi:plasmid maintenance system antidote protein VapI
MNENDKKKGVCDRLEEFRDHAGITLNAFSTKIGMDQSTLHYQFHGKRALSLDTVLNTLANFDVLSAEWLLRGEGDMIIEQPSQEDQEEPKADARIEALIDTITLLHETIKAKNDTIDALQAELSKYRRKAQKA